ncbi:MAG TPA: twin-arginine translocase subunit TatC [Thermoanaerobaculia bacterium]
MSTEQAGVNAVPNVEDPERELRKMSFLEHLEELRKRIMFSAAVLVVGFGVCWHYADIIFDWMERPITQYLPKGDKLAFTRLTGPFFLYMKVAFFAGLFLTSPLILHQLWLFISPGLYKRERRYAAPFIIFATLFFVAGGYFGYRWVLPATCGFFIETGQHFKQVVTVDDYFSFASMIVLACGLIFETPILIFFLARLGVVTPKFLLQKSKYAIVLAFIIAAVVTPTPDMVTQTALAVPMIVLYFIGVGVAYAFAKRYD